MSWSRWAAAHLFLLFLACGSVSPAADAAADGAGGAGGAAGDVGGQGGRGGAGGAAGDVGGRGGAAGDVGGQGGAACVPIAGMTSCRDGGVCGLVPNGSANPYCSTCRCANGVVGSGCCQCIYYVEDPARDSGFAAHTLLCCDQSCQS